MKTCPFCTIPIDDDSFFCDQCGKELRICVSCGAFARAKFFAACRSTDIVSAKEYAGNPKKNEVSYNHCLILLESGVKLALSADKGKYVIGRGSEDFSAVFGNDKFVSRTHAEILFDAENQCWKITDLASTNGTFVNEKGVPSNTYIALKTGDSVRIAFIKLKFE